MQIFPSLGKYASAAIAAGFLIAAVPGYAADAPMRMPPPGDAMAQQMNQHIQEHLDKLAGRLEIKASQEAAWQSFSGAMRDLMTSQMAMARGAHERQGAEPDAATMAREHADHAADHARKLAQVADATAKLEQTLSPEQKQVFDEVARHFAHEHFEHHAMMHGGHWWHDGHDGEQCGGHHHHMHDGPMHDGPGHDGRRQDGAPHGGAGGAPDSDQSMSVTPQ
jgi:hypothetical protein